MYYTNFTWAKTLVDDDGNEWPVGSFYGTTKPDIKIPSFFDERGVESGNDICHVKLLSAGYKLTGDTDSLVFREGRFFSNYKDTPTVTTASMLTFVTRVGRDVYQYNVTYQGYTYHQWIFDIYKYKYYLGSGVYHRTTANAYISIAYDVRNGGWKLKNQYSNYLYTPSISDLERYIYNGVILSSDMPEAHNTPYKSNSYPKAVYERLMNRLLAAIPPGIMDVWNIGSTYRVYSVTPLVPSKPLTSYLLLDEHALLFESGFSTQAYAAVRLKMLRQKAYLDALDHIPQLNENSISNILELVSFMKALIVDHRIEIPKSLQSLWLSYRYSYTTTKMDAEEAISFVHRHVDNDLLRSGIDCYGTVSDTISDVPVTVRCRLTATQKELSTLESIWTSLYRYGLTPSFYVMWDMVPYSFIVDWFIPVGDILNGYDKTHMYDRTYDITDVWYSIKYKQLDDGCTISSYTRWHEGVPPEFQGYYTLIDKGTTSDRVIGFRILDLASILIR